MSEQNIMHEHQAIEHPFITGDVKEEVIRLTGAEVDAFTYAPGEKAPLHTHEENHIVCVRSGRMRWTVADRTMDMAAGDVVVTPAGAKHSFEVLGDAPAQTCCIIAPEPAKPFG